MRGGNFHNDKWSKAHFIKTHYHTYTDRYEWTWTLRQVIAEPDSGIRGGWYVTGPDNLLVRDDDPTGDGYTWNPVKGRFMAAHKATAQRLLDDWVMDLDARQYIRRLSADNLSEGRCA